MCLILTGSGGWTSCFGSILVSQLVMFGLSIGAWGPILLSKNRGSRLFYAGLGRFSGLLECLVWSEIDRGTWSFGGLCSSLVSMAILQWSE